MGLHVRRRGIIGVGFVPISAVGGDDVFDEEIAGVLYRIHVFTTVGSSQAFEVQQVGTDGLVEYLIIAGGASGGGDLGGGGGAGGYRCSVVGEQSGGGQPAEPRFLVEVNTYPVVVGAGGPTAVAGATRNTEATRGNDGEPSSVFGITTVGGGGGGVYASTSVSTFKNGRPGGSGGGSGNPQGSVVGTPGAGTAGQGFAGGNGTNLGTGTDPRPSGGGGGASEVGKDGPAGNIGAAGGDGIQSNITGTTTFRAGGGGGAYYNTSTTGSSSSGGNGGGGNGGVSNGSSIIVAPGAGAANTGAGGGGGAWQGTPTFSGPGGSGIVIIRYPLQPVGT